MHLSKHTNRMNQVKSLQQMPISERSGYGKSSIQNRNYACSVHMVISQLKPICCLVYLSLQRTLDVIALNE